MTNSFILPERIRFEFGRLYITPAVERDIAREDIAEALSRHSQGDWGDLDEEDCHANEAAIWDATRILSAYHDRKGVKF